MFDLIESCPSTTFSSPKHRQRSVFVQYIYMFNIIYCFAETDLPRQLHAVMEGLLRYLSSLNFDGTASSSFAASSYQSSISSVLNRSATLSPNDQKEEAESKSESSASGRTSPLGNHSEEFKLAYQLQQTLLQALLVVKQREQEGDLLAIDSSSGIVNASTESSSLSSPSSESLVTAASPVSSESPPLTSATPSFSISNNNNGDIKAQAINEQILFPQTTLLLDYVGSLVSITSTMSSAHIFLRQQLLVPFLKSLAHVFSPLESLSVAGNKKAAALLAGFNKTAKEVEPGVSSSESTVAKNWMIVPRATLAVALPLSELLLSLLQRPRSNNDDVSDPQSIYVASVELLARLLPSLLQGLFIHALGSQLCGIYSIFLLFTLLVDKLCVFVLLIDNRVIFTLFTLEREPSASLLEPSHLDTLLDSILFRGGVETSTGGYPLIRSSKGAPLTDAQISGNIEAKFS